MTRQAFAASSRSGFGFAALLSSGLALLTLSRGRLSADELGFIAIYFAMAGCFLFVIFLVTHLVFSLFAVGLTEIARHAFGGKGR